MSTPSVSMEKARARVARLLAELAGIAARVCVVWPLRNSPWHVAVAQVKLEVERARRASDEKGGRA